MNDSIRAKMEQGIKEDVFPGAVLLFAKQGKIIFHDAFGFANRFTRRKMQPNSIFDLASLTKPLATALAIERLSKTIPGLMDQHLGTILKEFDRTDKREITIDMLLRHTSGYPAHKPYFKRIGKTCQDAVSIQKKLLIDQPLENPAGRKEVYSDLGFMVLRHVVETLSGMGLDQFVREKIYQPLEIDRLFFIPGKGRNRILDQYRERIVATQRCPWRGRLLLGEVDDENAWAVGGIDGHAGLFGDAYSIYLLCAELLKALVNPPAKVVCSRMIKQMVQKRQGQDKVAGFDTPSRGRSSSGRHFSSASIGHLGFTGTSFWIDPKASLIVILLTNRIHPSRVNELLKKFRPEIHDLIAEQFL